MTYSLAPYRSLGGSSPEIRPKFWWSLLHQSGLTHTPDLQWHKKLLCLPNISYKTSQCCLFFYPVSGDLGFDFGFKWLQITIIPRAVSQHTQSKLAIWPGASFYVETAAWAPSRLSFEKSMEGPLLRLGIRSSAIQNCPFLGFQPLSKRHWSPCMRNPTSNPGVFLVFFLLVQDNSNGHTASSSICHRPIQLSGILADSVKVLFHGLLFLWVSPRYRRPWHHMFSQTGNKDPSIWLVSSSPTARPTSHNAAPCSPPQARWNHNCHPWNSSVHGPWSGTSQWFWGYDSCLPNPLKSYLVKSNPFCGKLWQFFWEEKTQFLGRTKCSLWKHAFVFSRMGFFFGISRVLGVRDPPTRILSFSLFTSFSFVFPWKFPWWDTAGWDML